MNMAEKKSIRLEFTEKQKRDFKRVAKRQNIPLKNMLENECASFLKRQLMTFETFPVARNSQS
jgi:hypothetical protein